MSYPWQEASAVQDGALYAIQMLGKPVRTPLKRALTAPTQALADAIVEEWRAQGEKIAPQTMPLTRYMNSVIDTVADNRGSIVDDIAGYGETDLLCYRAGYPEELVARQAAAWDEPLTDFARHHDAPMVVTTGILPVEQPPETLAIIRRAIETHDNTSLAALSDLTALSGSIILALALSEGRINGDDAWAISRIDEEWQIEKWGEDDLATDAAKIKRTSFMDALRLLRLAQA